MTLGMMIGKDYDDPDWDKLLDQVTYEEMAELVGKGYHNTAMVQSVSKPLPLPMITARRALPRPDRCSHHTAYSDENIMAATASMWI